MFVFDASFLVVIPALLLAFYAQMKVKSTFNEYSQVPNSRGVTGVDAARYILRANGIHDVNVEEIPGELSDHYDPRDKTVRLSSRNYRGNSLAAVGVAAHEVGHAIQHASGYGPLELRHSILPVANIGSSMAMPLFLIGLLFQAGILMTLGIIFFSAALAFQVVTLPVEFNASSRALQQLGQHQLLSRNEVGGSRKVLNAAALTYVAAAAVSLGYLIQMLLLSGRD